MSIDLRTASRVLRAPAKPGLAIDLRTASRVLRAPSKPGLAMSKRKLTWLASAIVILNLLDAIFTLFYTGSGLAKESNPMMQGVLASSPIIFMVAKLGLVSLCVLLLWRLGNRSSAVVALLGATAMYTILIGYHLSAVPMLVAHL